MSFFVLLVASLGGAGLEVPDALRVPSGHKFLFRVEAEGVQIYESRPGSAGKPQWVHKGPLAGLTQAGKKSG